MHNVPLTKNVPCQSFEKKNIFTAGMKLFFNNILLRKQCEKIHINILRNNVYSVKNS